MQKAYAQIQNNWQKLSFQNERFNQIIHEYSLYAAEEIIEENKKNQLAFKKIKKSNIIIISKCKNKSNFNCFFACFNETVIFINSPSSFHLLKNIFSYAEKLNICFLNGIKDIFDENCKISYHNIINEYNSQFNDDVVLLGNEMKIKSHKFDNQTNFFLYSIIDCISALLIKNAYFKLPKNRIEDFFNDSLSQNNEYPLQKKITTYDYVQLSRIGCGSDFFVYLIYYIEKGQIFAIKKLRDPNKIHIIRREIDIYSRLKHPLIPQLIGVTTEDHIVTEYISGSTLLDKISYLNDDNMVNIFLQILIIMEYIHNNNYIYRDLKCNNVMIDDYNNAVLIDLNSMIPEIEDNGDRTNDFSIYVSGDSYWGDIRTIGKILADMMNENINLYINYPKLRILLMKCSSDRKNEIPTIFSIIRLIIYHYRPKIHISHLDDLLKMSIKKAIKNIHENENQPYRKIVLSLIYLDEVINKRRPQMRFDTRTKIIRQYNIAIILLQEMEKLKYKEPEFVLNRIHNCSHIDKSIFCFGNSYGGNDEIDYLYLNFKENTINPKIAFENLLKSALYNNPNAQYLVSFVYFHLVNFIDVDERFNKLFSDQYYDAIETRKLMYILTEICNEVPQNIGKGFEYLHLAAKNLQVNALHFYGRINIIQYLKYDEKNEKNKLFSIILAQKADNNKAIFEKMKELSSYIKCNIEDGIKYLQQAAEQRDISSIFLLSQIYSSGEIVSRNMEKVIYYLKLASDQQNSAANLQLGCIYYFGISVEPDIPKGINYLKLSADQGNSVGEFIMFNLYLENKTIGISEKQALHYIKDAAEHNFPDAQLEYGMLFIKHIFLRFRLTDIFETTKSLKTSYFEGFNKFSKIKELKFENDYKKGFKYIQKAANQNHSNAQCIIGLLYLEGLPNVVVKDVNLAIKYFLLAVDQNNYVAQYLLGRIYYYDMEGMEKEGIKYLKLSADNDYSFAQYELGLIFSNMNYRYYCMEEAIKYLELASKNGNSQAQCKLGYIYYLKKYGKYNMEKAINYFTKSANNECEDAQIILGIIYLNGKDVEQSINKGIELIKQSIKGESVRGIFTYGYLLHRGEYIKKNIEESKIYYKNASDINDIYSKNNLGVLYKTEKNMDESFHYFNEANQLYNDEVVMYNLAHNYLYGNEPQINIQQSIVLLIKSMNYSESKMLLCIALIKKYGFNMVNIENQLKNLYNLHQDKIKKVLLFILNQNLLNQSIFDVKYEQYRNIYYLYDYNYNPISIKDFNKVIPSKNNQKCIKKDINNYFYDGFGELTMSPS